jgi:hypothetical protein
MSMRRSWPSGSRAHHLAHWSAWTVHCTQEPGYLLRHTEGHFPPFRTRECELPAATYAGIIERLEMISVPLIAQPHVVVTDGSFVGMAYSSSVSFRWYGVPPKEWEPLARWHSETTNIFERVLQQQC